MNHSRETQTLFCMPFAGASDHAYRELVNAIDIGFSTKVISLPGRGRRITEPLQSDIHMMVEDIYKGIKHLLHSPYAIFGHSMGTILGYLLTKRILADGFQPPNHLFFTGRGGPSVKYDEPPTQFLSKIDFVKKLTELGGCPEEILNNSDLMDFFEPILRSDFKAVEDFNYSPSPPFNIPISVMIGSEEKTTYEQAMEWQAETSIPVEILTFPGKHFFIFDHKVKVMEYISNVLNRPVQKCYE